MNEGKFIVIRKEEGQKRGENARFKCKSIAQKENEKTRINFPQVDLLENPFAFTMGGNALGRKWAENPKFASMMSP